MAIPRWEAGTVVLDQKIFVFGGYTKGTKSSKRVDVFDPSDNSWTQRQDLPSAITHMNAVLDGRTVWLAGGFKDGYPGKAIDEVWNYNIDTDSYTAAPSLPEPRAGGGLALIGRELHYIGGLLPDRDTDAFDHWVLDLARNDKTWRQSVAMPKARNQFSTVVYDGKIVLIGGQYGHDNGQDDQPLVDVFDPVPATWSRTANLPKPHSHAEGSTFVHESRIFVLGGMTVGKRRKIDKEIVAMLPDYQWTTIGELPHPLSSPISAVVQDKLYLAGGSLNGADPQGMMWVTEVPSL